MALFFLLGLTAVSFQADAAAEAFRVSKADVRKDVIGVIEEQLAAFRAGDVSKAYNYAAAVMKAQTPLRRYAAIVRENYAEIWANTRAEYGLVRDDDTHAIVLVQVFSEGGEAGFDYVLLKERGGWRVGSVTRHEMRRKNNV